jgi:4-amino-4-deoxy-L-arabinose transferase-like glycosyltransferase
MHKKLLFAIFTLGLALRILFLSAHPSGFTPDEASFGYDAYSILKTSKDQWGSALPLTLKSFGDGKMPLYSYLAIPSISILGLSVFSTRLPNAIFGSLAILVCYFLVLKLFPKNQNKRSIALLSSFLLAISPWHIPLSRGAFEANLTTLLLPLGILFFFKGLKKPTLLILSAFFFGLNLFSYHSARLVTPLVALFLVFLYKNKLKFKNKATIFSAALSLFFLSLALLTYTQGAGSRLSSVSIFSLAQGAKEARYQATLFGLPDFLSRAFNNKATYLTHIFLQNYFSYLSPQFLVFEGAKEATYGMLPGRGVIYFVEIIFLLGAFHSFLLKKTKGTLILLFWLLVAPIPASLSLGPGHAANRSVIMLPALSIFSATGAVWIYQNTKFKKIFLLLSSLLLLSSFTFFLEDYFVQQPARGSKSMIHGAIELSQYLKSQEPFFDQIIVSKSISEPHIYIFFTQKYPPKLVQNQIQSWKFEDAGLSWVDQLPQYSLGKYTFRPINYESDKKLKNTLLVGSLDEFPQDVISQKIFYYPNKTPAYLVVPTNQKAFAQR